MFVFFGVNFKWRIYFEQLIFFIATIETRNYMFTQRENVRVFTIFVIMTVIVTIDLQLIEFENPLYQNIQNNTHSFFKLKQTQT